MYTYLKKNIFCLLIILISFITTPSKATEEDDHENRHGVRVTLKAESEYAKDEPSLKKSSFSSEVMPLEETKPSWQSYLTSPVKAVAYTAYDVLQYTVQNPKKSVFIGLFLVSQAIGVAADCNCLCVNLRNATDKVYLGYIDDASCNRACNQLAGNWNVDGKPEC